MALVVALAAVGLAVLGLKGREGAAEPRGSGPSPSASPVAGPSASTRPRAVALGTVTAHSGSIAELPFRIEAPPGTTWRVTLVVATPAGLGVTTKRLAAPVRPGRDLGYRLRLRLPPGHYAYRALAREAGGDAMAATRPGALEVLAPLTPGFPGPAAIRRALKWARGRSGDVGVAVVDSNGVVHGFDERSTFQAASLLKAMLLVAELRAEPDPDPAMQATLRKMIEESDNGAAYTVYADVGAGRLRRLAAVAGMRDYRPGSTWLDTRVSAADQARFFYDMQRYLPAGSRGFARGLLAGIKPIQRWGIPAAAGPLGWKVYFKGGWLGMDNRLMVQAARLTRGSKRWALAVMTDDNPSRSYGWDTQKGVTGLLLGEEPTAAYLAVVLEG